MSSLNGGEYVEEIKEKAYAENERECEIKRTRDKPINGKNIDEIVGIKINFSSTE